jgi:biopolymer transport protein ExbB
VRRQVLLAVLCPLVVCLVGWVWLGHPPHAAAQSKARNGAAGETLEEGPPTGGPAASSSTPKTRTALDSLIDSGVIGLIICLLSVVAVAFIIEQSISIRRTKLLPEETMNALDELIQRGQVNEAIELCRQDGSMGATIVLAGLERYKSSEFGFAEYRAAVEEAGEDQTGRLYRKTELLGLIGVIAPMLGLLGTVQGMIVTFNTIAETGGMAKPEDLAGGISLALVTTFEGLVVAIPTMVAFSMVRTRIDSLVSEAGNRIEQIMIPLGRRRS